MSATNYSATVLDQALIRAGDADITNTQALLWAIILKILYIVTREKVTRGKH